MFGLDWSEFFVIAVVALIVLGPKDLPRALYQMGKWARHARRITSEFQRHVDDIVRQAELDEVRKTVQDTTKQFDVRGQVSDHVKSVLDPVNDIRKAFDDAAPGATVAKPDPAAPAANGHVAPDGAVPDTAAPQADAAAPAADAVSVPAAAPTPAPVPAAPAAPATPAAPTTDRMS